MTIKQGLKLEILKLKRGTRRLAFLFLLEMLPHIKSSLKLAVSFLIPQQHLTGLDRFLTLRAAPYGLGSLRIHDQ
jgi:hypothetical protein